MLYSHFSLSNHATSLSSPGNASKKAKVAKKPTSRRGAKDDTAEIVLSYLYTMRQAGILAVEENDVLAKTGYARTDSTGYKIKVTKELIKEQGHVQRSSGKLELTTTGLKYIKANGLKVQVKAATMEDHQLMLKETALDLSSKAPKQKFDAIWCIMIDGKLHTEEELLSATQYARKDSTGYKVIMGAFRKLDMLDKEKNGIKFSDKVYKYGLRPAGSLTVA